VKTTNLRNKPIDRRRLSAEDRAQYNPRTKAKSVAQARLKRGQLAWENKVPVGRQERKPGTGGFTQGISMQQARVRNEGAKLARSKQLRGV
jgi:hypothetical protein